VTTTIVSDKSAPLFGERHFRHAEGDLLADVGAELHRKIAHVVADWCADTGPSRLEWGTRPTT
jgi:hypothetical protein